MPEVVARLELPPDLPPSPDMRVRVVVEDVSRADAASEVVGETVLTSLDVAHVRALEVAVPVDTVAERSRYSCRVHVDVGGTGALSSGDLITTQIHPVLTHGFGDRVTVVLTQI